MRDKHPVSQRCTRVEKSRGGSVQNIKKLFTEGGVKLAWVLKKGGGVFWMGVFFDFFLKMFLENPPPPFCESLSLFVRSALVTRFRRKTKRVSEI